MAILYEFLDRAPQALIEASELPVADGIAVAVRTTGYKLGVDEAVELSIVDLDGTELFHQRVKPQNIETWDDMIASGGIGPHDVKDAPELYQFEDEVIELFGNAKIVVGEHIDFIREIIESSWVSLPPFRKFDLVEQFCASHNATDYPGQPAAVASLEDIALYYGLPCDGKTASGSALAAAACYRQLVAEHVAARAAKGPRFWTDYERERAEAEKNDLKLQAEKRAEAIRTLRINAIMWLCAAAIFSNLAVQLYIRGLNAGFVIASAGAAIFGAIRWVQCLHRMRKLGR